MPAAIASSYDARIWILAAFPPTPRGRPNNRQAAAKLGISERTLRRWIHDPTKFRPDALKRLMQLAVLRGKGTLLWPTPSAETIAHEQKALETATRAVLEIEAGIDLDFWEGPKVDRLQPHTVYLLHYPRAHAYGITNSQHPKSLARIKRVGGEIISAETHPNYWAAEQAKYATLFEKCDLRCVAPTGAMPVGSRHAWREMKSSHVNEASIKEVK